MDHQKSEKSLEIHLEAGEYTGDLWKEIAALLPDDAIDGLDVSYNWQGQAGATKEPVAIAVIITASVPAFKALCGAIIAGLEVRRQQNWAEQVRLSPGRSETEGIAMLDIAKAFANVTLLEKSPAKTKNKSSDQPTG